MAPTRIYVKPLLPLIHSGRIGALAHITGGGLLENIPRVLPEGLHALVDADSWEQPRLMAVLQAQGTIEPEAMARTLHCGIGMVLVVREEDVAEARAEEHKSKLTSLMRSWYAAFCLTKQHRNRYFR